MAPALTQPCAWCTTAEVDPVGRRCHRCGGVNWACGATSCGSAWNTAWTRFCAVCGSSRAPRWHASRGVVVEVEGQLPAPRPGHDAFEITEAEALEVEGRLVLFDNHSLLMAPVALHGGVGEFAAVDHGMGGGILGYPAVLPGGVLVFAVAPTNAGQGGVFALSVHERGRVAPIHHGDEGPLTPACVTRRGAVHELWFASIGNLHRFVYHEARCGGVGSFRKAGEYSFDRQRQVPLIVGTVRGTDEEFCRLVTFHPGNRREISFHNQPRGASGPVGARLNLAVLPAEVHARQLMRAMLSVDAHSNQLLTFAGDGPPWAGRLERFGDLESGEAVRLSRRTTPDGGFAGLEWRRMHDSGSLPPRVRCVAGADDAVHYWSGGASLVRAWPDGHMDVWRESDVRLYHAPLAPTECGVAALFQTEQQRRASRLTILFHDAEQLDSPPVTAASRDKGFSP